jgi:hypothetical protein
MVPPIVERLTTHTDLAPFLKFPRAEVRAVQWLHGVVVSLATRVGRGPHGVVVLSLVTRGGCGPLPARMRSCNCGMALCWPMSLVWVVDPSLLACAAARMT